MAISEEELKKLVKVNVDVERISTVSSDGRNLLTRIPKEVIDFLRIKKGNKIRWLVKADSKEIKLEVIKNEDKKETNH